MKFKKQLAFTSAFASLLLTTLLPLTATAVTTTGNVSKKIPLSRAYTVKRSWTEARMRAAKPRIIKLSGSPKAATQLTLPNDPPVSAPSTAPKSTKLLQEIEPLAAVQTAITPLLYTYPFPYTRYSVRLTNYTLYPERTVGKIFFSQNGSDYVCSGSAVNSTNRRLIWTAGHCVSDGEGTFATDVVFVPAYRPGTNPSRPFGTWSACALYVTTAYHNNGITAQDLGAIQACDDEISGEPLHNYVGSLGYVANASRNQHWHSFGYPQGSPFNGTRMIVCSASHATNDSRQGTPSTIGIGCDMTGGSSGGPWVVRYSPSTVGAVNYINGLNSYGYNTQPNAMYSPYFGSSFLSLWTAAVNDGS